MFAKRRTPIPISCIFHVQYLNSFLKNDMYGIKFNLLIIFIC